MSRAVRHRPESAYTYPKNFNGIVRVSRRRPCKVCGKTDWCVFTRDEMISVCMRVGRRALRMNDQCARITI